MYKDEDKRKEAGKERSRRYRNKAKGVTNQGVTEKALPPDTTGIAEALDGQRQQREYKPSTSADNVKRGKDIKCFEDLPMDVQQTIDRMSQRDGKIDPTVKANRTAIAISYQHLYPGRYYSTGVA